MNVDLKTLTKVVNYAASNLSDAVFTKLDEKVACVPTDEILPQLDEMVYDVLYDMLEHGDDYAIDYVMSVIRETVVPILSRDYSESLVEMRR